MRFCITVLLQAQNKSSKLNAIILIEKERGRKKNSYVQGQIKPTTNVFQIDFT